MFGFSDLKGEKKIVQEAKENPEAFGRLFDKYYRPIFNYILRRTSDLELAEDLTSQTFFKALKGLGKFRWKNVSFSAWLYRIATNEVNTFYRKKKNRIFVNIDKVPEISARETSDGDYQAAEMELKSKIEFAILHEKIKKLSPTYQTIISLRFFERKKISEIAEILGKSEGTVKSQLHRALNDLRGHMGQEREELFPNRGIILPRAALKVWEEKI